MPHYMQWEALSCIWPRPSNLPEGRMGLSQRPSMMRSKPVKYVKTCACGKGITREEASHGCQRCEDCRERKGRAA